jgi:hypothetical protein
MLNRADSSCRQNAKGSAVSVTLNACVSSSKREGQRRSALATLSKHAKRVEISIYSAEVCVVLNDSGAPLTGIAKMVCHKKIILACCAVQEIAHQLLATLRVLENAQVKRGQAELKILVSVVRFRPRPPFLNACSLKTCYKFP